MASKFDNTELTLLKQFVELCKGKPELLHSPQLKFFKDWLERYLLCTLLSWYCHGTAGHVHGKCFRYVRFLVYISLGRDFSTKLRLSTVACDINIPKLFSTFLFKNIYILVFISSTQIVDRPCKLMYISLS